MSRPDSANTMAKMPSSPNGLDEVVRGRGSRRRRGGWRAPDEATEGSPRRSDHAAGWFHSVQPTPDRPSAVSKRHRARGKRAWRVTGAVVVDEVDGAEVARARWPCRGARTSTRRRGGEAVLAELLLGRAHVDLLDAAAGRHARSRGRRPPGRARGSGRCGSGCRPRGRRPSRPSRGSTSRARPSCGRAGRCRRTRSSRRRRGSRRGRCRSTS